MISVTVMYPKTEKSTFDMDYYAKKHMPESIRLLSAHPGWRGVSVARGDSGIEAGSEPIYAAVTTFLFNSIEEFWEASTPHGEKMGADMVNYTNVTPTYQISEVLIHQ